MNVDKSAVDAGLDRGDGVCVFFNLATKLCNIYDHRPLICNVDESYEVIYKHIMTKEEYYNLNYRACELLKSEKREEH